MSTVLFYEPFYDFERFFDEAARNGNQGASRRRLENNDGAVRSLKPSVCDKMDLHETGEKDSVMATFELPGLKKEDVSIDVHNGHLTVSAETKQSTEHEQEGYAVRERRLGKISRTLQLPLGVKEEEIKASMENGLLTVTFPKTAPELASRKISIA